VKMSLTKFSELPVQISHFCGLNCIDSEITKR
jgi:hypothetical protein